MKFLLRTLQYRRQGLIVASGLFLFVSLIFFKNLWLADRQFPTVPLFSFMIDSPSIIHLVLYVLLVVFSLLTVLFGRSRFDLTAVPLCFLVLVSCGLDMTRLQPAIYLALTTLILLIWSGSLVFVQLVFMLTYFWAGLQKFNSNFISEGFEKLLLVFNLPEFFHPWMPALAILAALFELGLGVLLFFRKTRNTGVILATLMHLFILLLLGPLGMNWEPFVWPWNVWMICCVWLLFYQTDNRILDVTGPKFQILLVSLFFVIGPLLNFFGSWNDYLSFKFYSSNTRGAAIKFQSGSPWVNHALFASAIVKEDRINIAQWGFAETGCPDFPSEWYYVRLFRQVCKRLDVPAADRSVHMNIYESPGRFDGLFKRKEIYCSELTKTF